MSDVGDFRATDEATEIDADVFAVAFMVRQAMREVALLKAPENPEREVKRMRDEVLQEIKKFRFSKERTVAEIGIRTRVYEAVMHLMPLGADNDTLQ